MNKDVLGLNFDNIILTQNIYALIINLNNILTLVLFPEQQIISKTFLETKTVEMKETKENMNAQ